MLSWCVGLRGKLWPFFAVSGVWAPIPLQPCSPELPNPVEILSNPAQIQPKLAFSLGFPVVPLVPDRLRKGPTKGPAKGKAIFTSFAVAAANSL